MILGRILQIGTQPVRPNFRAHYFFGMTSTRFFFLPVFQLWEMACARHIGFHSIPIVCINVDGYYDPFRAMLSRAHADQLLYKDPFDILHFEETPE